MRRALLRSYWLLPGMAMSRLWEQLKVGGFLDEDYVIECEKLRSHAQHFVQELKDKNLGFDAARQLTVRQSRPVR